MSNMKKKESYPILDSPHKRNSMYIDNIHEKTI